MRRWLGSGHRRPGSKRPPWQGRGLSRLPWRPAAAVQPLAERCNETPTGSVQFLLARECRWARPLPWSFGRRRIFCQLRRAARPPRSAEPRLGMLRRAWVIPAPGKQDEPRAPACRPAVAGVKMKRHANCCQDRFVRRDASPAWFLLN